MFRHPLLTRLPQRTSRLVTLAIVSVLMMAVLPVLPAQTVAAASGAITVTNWTCPDEFDVEGAAFGDLDANCVTPAPNETFSLLPTGGAASNMDTNASGVATWASSDPGDGTITQVDPGPYSSKVFCAIHNEGEFGTIGEIGQTIAGTIPYDIPDGQLMTCEWFNYQDVVAIQGSEIRLQKWVCPDDFDAEAAGTIDELWAGCTTPGADFPFSRVPDGGDPPVELNADASGQIVWPEFPAGTGHVTETAAEMSLSRVFCTSYDLGVIGVATYNEVDATGNQISYDLESGKGLDCEWFNYTPEGETSGIVINKLACPEGDWSEASLDDLLAGCTEGHADVEFNLSSPSTGLQDTTDAGGFVGWTVPSGDTYTVTEVTPGGFGSARVFCTNYDQVAGPGEFAEVDAAGNAITETLDIGYSLECLWLNVPAELGTIVVDKFACPEGYGTGTGYQQLAENCTSPVSGVTFTPTPAGVSGINGQTDDSGRAVFESVPLGEGTLGEQVPQQYNWVEVYCAISDDVATGPYQAAQITAQNVMGYLMEPTQVWSCSWFNLQLDPGPASLTINKYTCQAGHDPIEPLQTLVSECAEPTEDITFTLENDATSMSASTGTGGAPATISFSELEPGSYLLTEQIPDTVQLAYIQECRSDVRAFSYPFSPFAIIEPDGRININLLPGEDMECDWYNVLADSPGTVTIVKYWCQGDVVNEANCEIYGGGASFTLAPVDGGQPIPATTGEDGTVTVEASGAYEISESDFEWCAAQSDAANAQGQLVVGPGADVTIEIFNCGPMPLQ